ncbi:MAG: 3-hydroxylacyl-ACP dehydratase [Colwellia sp.]|nr:3-hydroxylacyl-ACP dehydratase [Colwellia sp.]MCW8864272.1 3-hydroxylacyl-ACP dehydratase [Colwellia sp.]MCW9082411.1 3-hydroxylacyl-ACP dehydratase [Colwellia sp.]
MYNIEAVIKHRKPMRLVDELISFDEDSASVLVNINEACEFYQADQLGVPSYVGIEYMAQCIAAQAGANELASGGDIKLGFLLGTRKYKPNVTFFSNGKTLKVSATRLMEDAAGLSVFDCLIVATDQEDIILAQAKINVFQPENSAAYLQE